MHGKPSWAQRWRATGVASAGLVLAAVACRFFAETGLDAWSAVTRTEVARPADALLALVAAVGALLAAWLGTGVVVSALARLPGAVGQAFGLVESRVAPAALRRVVGVLVGAAVVAGAGGGTAMAQDRPAAAPSSSVTVGAPEAVNAPDPAFAPSWPVQDPGHPAAVAPDPTFAPTTGHAPADLGALRRPTRPETSTDRHEVVVKRGDTLWDIAEAHVHPGATTAEIAHACHRWYEVNKHVIGDDPDLILVGQQLIAPPPRGGSR